jgi:hypothetical protein
MHAIVVLPDRDVDLGVVGEDEIVVSTRERAGGRIVLGAEKIKKSELNERRKQWATARRTF